MAAYKKLNKKDHELILALADHGMKCETAAKAIGMSRNSAYCRENKIYRITGLDPRDFYDLQKLVEIANQTSCSSMADPTASKGERRKELKMSYVVVHQYVKPDLKRLERNEKADCSKCMMAERTPLLDGGEGYLCKASLYDTKTLACFVPERPTEEIHEE